MSTFAGKFVFFYGDDGCQKGEIVEQIGDRVLICWDRMRGKPDPHDAAMVCFAISDMVAKLPDDEESAPMWEFFQTREQLEAQHDALHGEVDGDFDDEKVPTLTVVN
jgi:hypothetical protein